VALVDDGHVISAGEYPGDLWLPTGSTKVHRISDFETGRATRPRHHAGHRRMAAPASAAIDPRRPDGGQLVL
jgi:hypothetical protein